MDTSKLKDTLKAVRMDLESTANVDSELKELLYGLDHDIHQVLDREPRSAPRADGLIERAQAISARLAIQHPHIEPALREVADMLGKMGI
jgi:hypothetical protein